jgi:hypothetical protein
VRLALRSSPSTPLGLVLALTVAACGPTPSPLATTGEAPAPTTSAVATSSPSPTADRVSGWRSDLAMLVPAMDRIHPKIDHGTPRSQLDAAAASLSQQVPTLTDDQVMVGVLRIVAMVSAEGCDAHTGAFIWGLGTYPVDSLPLRLWWFREGVVVVDALPPYEDLVGLRIGAIDGRPIDEVLATVDPLIPRDNSATVRLLMPRYLLMPQILRGLGLAGGGSLDLDVVDGEGATQTVSVEPIPMADYNEWAGAYGLLLPANPDVIYLSRIGDALWWERLEDTTLFVQYNRVDVLPEATLGALASALHEPGLERVVVDVRHNYGGEVRTMTRVLALLDDRAVDREGALFVITGRNTYSAASLFVARLVAQTSAIVVGEPMGGCPTSYGDSSDVRLPFSGIDVSVSGLLEVAVSADDTRQTIDPDVATSLSADEWAARVDPALAAILATGP